MSGDNDGEVGYGKPPVHSRFASGQSGNPAGRPKGPQTLARDLREEMEEAVTLTEGGGERTLSKQRRILRSLTAKAIDGDAKATVLVLDLVQRLIGTGAEPEPEPEEGDNWGGDPREILRARIEEIALRLRADRSNPYEDGPAPEPEPEPEA